MAITDEDVTVGMEDVTEAPVTARVYGLFYVVFTPLTQAARMLKFVEDINEAVSDGGIVVQWMQTSVNGDPAGGGMLTQITAVVEFGE